MTFATEKPSIEWDKNAKPLSLDPALFNKTALSMDESSRHIFVVGDTGSGKTRSVIKPLLAAKFAYESHEGYRFSAFVIDPKRELADYLTTLDAQQGLDRVLHIDPRDETKSWQLNMFEGVNTMKRLEDKLIHCFHLFNVDNKGGDNEVFRNSGKNLLIDCARLEEHYYAEVGTSLFATIAQLVDDKDSPDTFLEGLRDFLQMALAMTWVDASDLPMALRKQPNLLSSDHEINVFDLLGLLVATNCKETPKRLLRPFQRYMSGKSVSKPKMADNLKQFGYYVSYLELMFNTLTSPSFKRVFDLDKLLSEPYCELGLIQQMIEQEKFIVISPGVASKSNELVVKILKGLVFNAMMTRSNMLAPMAYVADEFHNFVTVDPVTGDQNLLDKCRSFRISCVLATQSVMHLKNKVLEQNPATGSSALYSLLINLATKVVLRTSDNETKAALEHWIPSSPTGSGRHVLDARPLMSLRVGEYYFSAVDGRWGLERVELKTPDLERVPAIERDSDEEETRLAV